MSVNSHKRTDWHIHTYTHAQASRGRRMKKKNKKKSKTNARNAQNFWPEMEWESETKEKKIYLIFGLMRNKSHRIHWSIAFSFIFVSSHFSHSLTKLCWIPRVRVCVSNLYMWKSLQQTIVEMVVHTMSVSFRPHGCTWCCELVELASILRHSLSPPVGEWQRANRRRPIDHMTNNRIVSMRIRCAEGQRAEAVKWKAFYYCIFEWMELCPNSDGNDISKLHIFENRIIFFALCWAYSEPIDQFRHSIEVQPRSKMEFIL